MNTPLKLTLNSPQVTADTAARISSALQPGDTILLEGTIGSGKTHFARALIQSVLAVPEDVPSPTFTLVQVYETRIGEVWHSDLYRLTSVEEIEELGLTEAFDTSICLVEWPDKLGPLTPESALLIRFVTDPDDQDTRHLVLSWSDPKWNAKLEMIQ
ncbi:tRNA (adenosine(37)-N6)-threonylcarbamoyltransferase complex ATPase subunit type 1 TsaE [uncultured Ruegeria sp.]|uniref:tRNA (adenosine(37)-N6)-threonylcarbamoyltransferase complex ATPase subunit type 1 TsaE n=1 Tax=uncultured Ruegeria sp. TaxID=259304 RepID=UPI002612EB54|nr:tRNA (adenosine(37)-N6)-threonylcarbamoyltransferase complex ATPase subunit type 1 TsaE [uncultured Ruegeria sp.]